jgi:hypothetical protein
MDFKNWRLQRNTTHNQLNGDVFEKFHFSLVDARLAGNLVDRIKNRKAKEILKDLKKIKKKGYPKTRDTHYSFKRILHLISLTDLQTVRALFL